MIEFTLTERPDLQFRTKDVSPIKMLALQTILDFNNFEKTEALFTFILENVEVKIKDSWMSVKEKGRDVYYPIGIEKDMKTLMALSTYYLNNVVSPLFTQSNK